MIGIPGIAPRSVWGGLLLAVMVFEGAGSVAAAPIPTDGLGQEALKLPPGAFRRLGDVRMRFENTLSGLVAIPGGNTIATVTEKGISIWDPASGFELATAPLPELDSKRALPPHSLESSRCLIASRDGKWLILLASNQLFRYALPLKGAPETWSPGAPKNLSQQKDRRLRHLFAGPSADVVYGVTHGDTFVLWKRGDPRWTRVYLGNRNATKLAVGGDCIATSIGDNQIQVFDINTKAVLSKFTLPEPVYSMVLSEDGKSLVACAFSMALPLKVRPSIRVWSVPENREIAVLEGLSTKMILSLDGKKMAYGRSSAPLEIVDLQTAKVIQKVARAGSSFSNPYFTSDGQYLLQSDTGLIHVWDVKAGRTLHETRGHAGNVNRIVACGNDGWISAGEDGAIIQWDGAGREVRRFLESQGPVRALVLSPDGATLYAATFREVHAWDAATGKELRTTQSRNITALALTPDSRFLVLGGRENVSVIDATSFKLDRPPIALKKGDSLVHSLVIPSQERGLSYNPFTKEIQSWDLKTSAERFSIETKHQLFRDDAHRYDSAFAVTRDGQRIIAPTVPGMRFVIESQPYVLGIWDAKTGRLLDTVESPLPILTIAAHPNGKECALGHPDGTIGLLDLEKKTVRKLFEGHRGGVLKLAYSRDGKTLASSSTDTTILLWKLDAKD